jgi:membrane-bound serine protease (ClpP class)
MRRLRALVWLGLIACGLLLGQQAYAQDSAVVVGTIDGVINPITAQYVDRVLARAETRGAAAVIFVIDTPGALVSSTLRITTRLLNARVPVVTFVAPRGARALSAGTFITMAGHVAAMAPATSIGAAHPVDASGGDIGGDAGEKATSALVTEAQKIALARGRNVQWAEDAVRNSTSARDDEALRLDVVDLLAADVDELVRQLDGRTVEVAGASRIFALAGAAREQDDPNLIENFLHTIVDPQIALLLLTLGTYGLIFELSNPSLLFPGIIGVIAIVLALFALGTLDANAAGLALVVFAVLLFVSEIWIASHGLLTAGGVAALILGALLLFPPWMPTLPGARLAINPLVIAAVAALPAAFFVLVLRGALEGRKVGVPTGARALIGTTGIAESDLVPMGVVRVGGEAWTAVAASGTVAKGESIRVRDVDSVRLIVERLQPGRRD